MQNTILRNRFEQSWSVIDRRHGNIGGPKAVEQVNSVFEEKSVRIHLGNLTNKSSVSSIYRMLRYNTEHHKLLQ